MTDASDKTPSPDEQERGRAFRTYNRALSAVIEFVVAVVLCTGGGYWLDSRLASSPWGVLGGSLLGVAVGMYIMIKRLLGMGR